MSTKREPNSPNIVRPTERIGAEKLLLRRKCGLSIGCVLARSKTTKAARIASPPMPVASTSVDAQPCAGASMIA